jgi:hypothetical protein
MDPEIYRQLVIAVVLAIVSLLSFAARGLIQVGVNYLQVKLGNAKFDQVKQRALTIVRYLEQSPVYQDFDGAKKKELAMIDLTNFAEKFNIPVTHEDLDKLSEEAVRIVKKEIGEAEWGSLDPEIDAELGGIVDKVTGSVGE